MAISNRLCNATQFEAEIKWDKGVVITVPADGYVELPYHQMEDFIETKPGYEQVKSLIDSLGLFVNDPSVNYDVQALRSLRACIRARQEQYNGSIQVLRQERAAAGIHDSEEAFAENLRRLGLVAFKEKTEKLIAREKEYSKLVEAKEESAKRTAKNFDPELTVILHTGLPKEFQSKLAKQLWMKENPELVAADPSAPAPKRKSAEAVNEA